MQYDVTKLVKKWVKNVRQTTIEHVMCIETRVDMPGEWQIWLSSNIQAYIQGSEILADLCAINCSIG